MDQRELIKNVKRTPLLSIITVVRNGEQFLEKTIISILNQDFNDIEYIIIDGKSTDSTLEIIHKYSNRIDNIISEPDKGIYDAMNKGIGMARGRWVNFMNAGDVFLHSSVCSLIASELITSGADVLYGDVIALNSLCNSELLVKARPISDIWKGMIFSHQACFIKSEVLKVNTFDLKFKVAADYKQILMLHLNNYKFKYYPEPLSVVNIGGVSYSNNKTITEQAKIVHSFKPFSWKIFYFIYPSLLNLIKSVFGSKFTSYIRDIKWKCLGGRTLSK